MAKVLTLSDGTEVLLKEKFSHKAESAYAAARDAGAFDEETVVEGELRVVRKTPVVNYGKAVEAALLVMVERVKKGDADTTPTADWLADLDEDDYDLLATEMIAIRKAGRERGKKSAR